MANHSSVETLKEKKMSWQKVIFRSISCLMGEDEKSSKKSACDQTNKNEVAPQFNTYFINHSSPPQVNPPSSISLDVPLTLPPSLAGQVEAPGLVEIPEQIRGLGQVGNQEKVGALEQIGDPDQILYPIKIAYPIQIEDPRRKEDLNLVQSSSITSLSYPVLKPNPEVAEDNLQYQFYSVSSGSLHFKVRASNDAHIALAMGVQESEPKIEIFIGGWGNSKSSISRKRTSPSIPLTRSVEVETPGILNRTKFRGFWVRWDGGIVSVCHENRATPFISWSDPEPFPICYVGVRTSWGTTGTWKIEDGTEFNTSPKVDYVFKPCASGFVEFEYRGSHKCHVCLTTTPGEIAPTYEIILGARENTQSEIRYNKHKPSKVTVSTPGLLNPYEFRKFLVEWRYGRIVVRMGGAVIMEWMDPTLFPITHFGVRTGGGDCRIKHFPTYWNVLQR